jgi:hypothetical protein
MNAIITTNDINEAHRLARQHAESAVQYAIRCGELLMQQKAKLRHGEFGAWVQANCEFSYSSARAYMLAAAKQTDSALAFSSLREALEHGRPEVAQLAPVSEPEVAANFADTPIYDTAKRAIAALEEWTASDEFKNLGQEFLPLIAKMANDLGPENDAAAARLRAEKCLGLLLRPRSEWELAEAREWREMVGAADFNRPIRLPKGYLTELSENLRRFDARNWSIGGHGDPDPELDAFEEILLSDFLITVMLSEARA